MDGVAHKEDVHMYGVEDSLQKVQSDYVQKGNEMERQELEYKFEQLLRERHKCEKSAIKAIKLRYEQFLEEDRQRIERNNNLLRMLERIDYQAATLAAKTERLKLLKAQHELYLMRNWNIQRAILPSFESSMPIVHPVTEILPINFTQQQTFIPSQPLQQQNISSTLLSSSALPAQQSIYYPPFKIPPQKGETNLKSDFVKYLSQINQFRDIYDKNGMSDSTYQSDLSVKGIEDPLPAEHQFNRINNISPMPPYPNAYYQDQKAAIDSRFYGNNKFIPPSHPLEHRNPEIYDYLQQHQYQQKQQQQKNDTIHNRTEHTEAIKPKLTNDEIIKTTPQHTIPTASYKNSATTNDFLVNNSSSTQPDINNTAVSISNTSANATAINTNGVIKAIHQNKDENYVPPVRFQLNDNDVFSADDGGNISGVAYSNPIGYVNRMSELESSIRQISNESARSNPMVIDAGEGMKELDGEHEKLTPQRKKNYEFSDVRPDIDKIEEVIYGEKINYLEIEEPTQQQQQHQQHNSSEEFNKPKHIIPSSTTARNDVHVDIDESKVVKGMEQLNIVNASENDGRNLKEALSFNEHPQNGQENKFHLPECRAAADLNMTDLNAYESTDDARMPTNDDINKFDPIYYGENETNATSGRDINNPMYTQEAGYEKQSNNAIHYQQPQPQNIDHESMSKVYQSQEVNYGLPVADTEDVSHATSFQPMQQGYQQTAPPPQQQSPGNYDNTFNHENQYTHGTQPYVVGTEQQQEYQPEYSEYSNPPEQTVEYNQSEYYSTEQQSNERGDSSYPVVDNENGNYDGQQYQQGNVSEEGIYQVPYYGGEVNVDANTNNVYGGEATDNEQYQDQSYDNQNQHYQQQNLEQYTPDGQSERYTDGQEYQEQLQQQQQPPPPPQQQQHTENVDQNYDTMYQYTQDPNYNNQDEYDYPQESHPPTEQYSNNAYYSQEPGENYYPEVNQMPANTLNLASNSVQNSYMESDAVNEITQPPTLTNVPVKHANDSQYENKYAPDGGEESSTTYSENVNIPQQILNGGAVESMLPVGVQGNIIGNVESRVNVPPNYLESETDESSSTQQVKEIANDESDFDFSAN